MGVSGELKILDQPANRAEKRATSLSRLKHRLYRERLEQHKAEWAILLETLGLRSGVAPWDVLQSDMNDFIKKERTSPMEETVALAGFWIALSFDRVELADDFLQHIRKPPARLINEFLHKIRLSCQWGSWGIEPKYVNKWLESAQKALSRCPDLDSLSLGNLHYSHEVLLGRLIKLGGALPDALRKMFLQRVSGDIRYEDVERLMQSTPRAMGITGVEITLSDLRRRLAEMSVKQDRWIVGLSLIIAENFISYIFTLPFITEDAVGRGFVVMPNIEKRLADVRLELDESVGHFAGQEWQNLVRWPQDMKTLCARIFSEIFAMLERLPDHVLIATNAPFNGLPWQHLIAATRGENAVGPSNAAWARSDEPTPSVSLISNFASMVELSGSRREPGLIQCPGVDTPIRDAIVRQTMAAIRADLTAFRREPPYSLAFVVGHGPQRRPDQSAKEEFQLPRVATDEDVELSVEQWVDILDADIVFLGSCGVGAPGKTFFGDVGGIVSRFLMKSGGMLIAPVSDVSSQATTVIARRLLRADHGELLTCYRDSWSDPKGTECYLYNLYGFPSSWT